MCSEDGGVCPLIYGYRFKGRACSFDVRVGKLYYYRLVPFGYTACARNPLLTTHNWNWYLLYIPSCALRILRSRHDSNRTKQSAAEIVGITLYNQLYLTDLNSHIKYFAPALVLDHTRSRSQSPAMPPQTSRHKTDRRRAAH